MDPRPISKETMQLLRRGYDAFSRRNLHALLAVCDPEIVFRPYVAQVDAVSYHGHEGLRDYLQSTAQALDEFSMTPQEFEDLGDWLLVKGTLHTRGHGSGVEVERSWAQILRLRRGRFLEWQTYGSEEEALEAAQRSSRFDRTTGRNEARTGCWR